MGGAGVGGRDAVHLLEAIGEVVSVVESAGVGDLADRDARLVFEHILGTLEADEGDVFVEAEARRFLEDAGEVLGADVLHFRNRREAQLVHIVILDIFYRGFDEGTRGALSLLSLSVVAKEQIENLARIAAERVARVFVRVGGILPLDFEIQLLDRAGQLTVAEERVKLLRMLAQGFGYEILVEIDEQSGVRIRTVVGAVDDPRRNEHHVARNNVVGPLADEVMALALLHVIYLVIRVVMLGGFAAASAHRAVEIIAVNIFLYRVFHLLLPPFYSV